MPPRCRGSAWLEQASPAPAQAVPRQKVRDRAFLSDRFRSVVLGLATSNKIWLAFFAGVFIVFALLSSFVFPRWRPDFPGEQGRKWFIIATLVLFVAMLFAVNTFAKEDEEAHGETAGEVTTTEPGETEPTPTETTPAVTTPGTPAGRPRGRGGRSSRRRGAVAATRSRPPARTGLSAPISTRHCQARTRRSSANRSSTRTRRSRRAIRRGSCRPATARGSRRSRSPTSLHSSRPSRPRRRLTRSRRPRSHRPRSRRPK